MARYGNYPAITEEELGRIIVPVPHGRIQERIAEEVARRRDATRQLRDDAKHLWDAAKQRFEEELLGHQVTQQRNPGKLKESNQAE